MSHTACGVAALTIAVIVVYRISLYLGGLLW
jgi:hypothetical protein